MAELDDLTGLGNYRMFMRQLTAEVARSRRYEDPFSLVLLDLDGFKAINDELGHLAGDDALRLVAVALRDALREEDVCCRQGGDEFAVIAVRAGEEEARELAERLAQRDRARSRSAPTASGASGASVGWATFGAPARSVDELILRADAALRQTKRTNGGALRGAGARARQRSGSARDGRDAGTHASSAPAPTNRLALLAGLARALPGARDERALAETTVAFLAGAFDTVGAAVVGLDADGERAARRGQLGRRRRRRRRRCSRSSRSPGARSRPPARPSSRTDVERRWLDGGARAQRAGRRGPRGVAHVGLPDDRLRPPARLRAVRAGAGGGDRRAARPRAHAAAACSTGCATPASASCTASPSAAPPRPARSRGGSPSWRGRRAARSASATRDLRALYLAALFHDVGTVGVPAVLLSHPGELRDEERAVLREHALIGERMLRGLPLLAEAAPIVRHEHERFDGTGYPDRLAGEQIPLAARILLACDAFVSMTSPRPWRPPRSTAVRARGAAPRRRHAARPARRRRAARRARRRGRARYAAASSAISRSCDRRSSAVHAIGVTISVPTPASR